MPATLKLPTSSTPPRRPGRGGRGGGRGGGAAGVTVVVLVGAAAIAGWAWWNGSVGSVAIRPHCTATANGTVHELGVDQADNAAVIVGIAQRRGLPARAASIGIATAIQESKLRNIDYGDRDSLGLFQQRPSQGWGTQEQILDPVYATNAFYDELVKVEGYQDMEITDVAQAVQKSAFPEAYADHEPEGRVIASSLSGYSPAGFTCTLREPAELSPQEPRSGGLTARADAVRDAARTETGERNPAVSDDGRRLTYAAAGSREAWALASWAVARADALHVTRVAVGDRVWTRAESPEGWQGADALTSGRVVISVA